MRPSSNPPDRRGVIARLAIVATLVAFVTVPWSAEAVRAKIVRELPESENEGGGGGWRPAPDRNQYITFLAPNDGKVRIAIGADVNGPDNSQLSFWRLDNIFVLKTTDFQSMGSTVVEGDCYDGGPVVDALVFNVLDMPPTPVPFVLFETFENGIPSGWSKDGTCDDPDATAPHSVVDNSPFAQDVCRGGTFTGGSIAFLDPTPLDTMNLDACPPTTPMTGPTEAKVTFDLPVGGATGLEPGVQYSLQLWWGPPQANDFIDDDAEFFVDIDNIAAAPPAVTDIPTLGFGGLALLVALLGLAGGVLARRRSAAG